jgi:hypothetical protein
LTSTVVKTTITIITTEREDRNKMAKRTFDIPDAVNIRLKAIAGAQGTSVLAVIIRLLDEGSMKEYPAARRKLKKMAEGK